MMKRNIFFATILLACFGCSHEIGNYGNEIDVEALKDKDPSEVTKEDIQANVANIFGAVDPNQDWSMITAGTISVTADADLDDIVKVQILSESPYMNAQAAVLAEANATNGQTVELAFDAPSGNSRLIAACVDSQGRYYVKGFDVGQSSLSFSQAAGARAMTRAAEVTLPKLADVKLELKNSCLSYATMRTLWSNAGETKTNSNIELWKGKGWENERLWRASDNKSMTQGGWYVDAQCLRRDVATIDPDEKTVLEDIFNSYLIRATKPGAPYTKISNIETVRNNPLFSLENNQLTSNGEPLIITPVQMASNEIQKCVLYYYYYNPQDTVGMTSAQVANYLKNLPKYRAISCYHTKSASGVKEGEFFKKHEFLLPYYGDQPLPSTQVLEGYKSDGKLYRIRNGQAQDGTYYYARYSTDENKRLAEKIEDADGELFQLWQIFKKDDGTCYLYNVGSQTFLVYSGSWNTTNTDIDYLGPSDKPFKIDEANHYLMRSDNVSKYIGSDMGNNFGIWSDKATSIGDKAKWYFEEYTGPKKPVLKSTIERISAMTVNPQSFEIPAGYKVAFMLRKGMQNENDCYYHYYASLSYNNEGNGELYGDGRLNTEINQYPNHFISASSLYGLRNNDPRIAIFGANKKVYMCFEDGSDCQFSDMIVEINSGVKDIDAAMQIDGQTYTLCFEDRQIGDYDLNDVVIQAERINLTQVKYTLIAAGAYDELYLRNINGKVLNEDTEVHAIFGVPTQTFVNTEGGNNYPVVEEVIDVDPSFTFSDLSQQVYIYNKSQDYEIRLSAAGDPDPHAIIIPAKFYYPKENSCITTAYPLFKNWAQDATTDQLWYQQPLEDDVLIRE